jgi:hypothetical protein
MVAAAVIFLLDDETMMIGMVIHNVRIHYVMMMVVKQHND